jgi:hypothetical protein
VCQNILDSHAEPLLKKSVIMALQGNPTALRICMDRLMPARGQPTLRFKLPPSDSIDDLAAASRAVVNGVARGQLTPAEGQAFCSMLEDRRRAIETQDQEQRIRALEDLNKPSSRPR